MAEAATESRKQKTPKPKVEQEFCSIEGVALRLTRKAAKYHCALQISEPFAPLEVTHDAKSFAAICSWLEEVPAQVTAPLTPVRTALAAAVADQLDMRAQSLARAQAVERAIGDILALWALREQKGQANAE